MEKTEKIEQIILGCYLFEIEMWKMPADPWMIYIGKLLLSIKMI